MDNDDIPNTIVNWSHVVDDLITALFILGVIYLFGKWW